MKLHQLLSSRFKTPSEKTSKTTQLASLAQDGGLSSFSGVFRVHPLSEQEQLSLRAILDGFKNEEQIIDIDLEKLYSITAEIYAIQHQALLLHGERIKQAQDILKPYKDGAFSAWLIATYGNRQTPYNFLQYYELFHAIPSSLQEKLDTLPRQAAYVLASRNAPIEDKQKIIEEYAGESKPELLHRIRTLFPLHVKDRRGQRFSEFILSSLIRIKKQIELTSPRFSSKEKERLCAALLTIKQLVE